LRKDSHKKEQIPSKKRICHPKKTFRGPWSINCQEQFTYPICEEYVAQMFNFSFLSKIKFPFQKVIFTRHIARISGEDK
jgi:hypothetical protein